MAEYPTLLLLRPWKESDKICCVTTNNAGEETNAQFQGDNEDSIRALKVRQSGDVSRWRLLRRVYENKRDIAREVVRRKTEDESCSYQMRNAYELERGLARPRTTPTVKQGSELHVASKRTMHKAAVGLGLLTAYFQLWLAKDFCRHGREIAGSSLDRKWKVWNPGGL